MKSSHTLLFLSVTLLAPSLATAYTWPSPQYDALEKLLYEGRRLDGRSLSDLASGCKTRAGKVNGGVVAAEWLRFAFHDFAAYDATTKTGGLDASVFYELDRPENVGVSMTNSASDYLQFTGKYVSRADLVALGTVIGTASCGGMNIPFRGGRPEAVASGVSAVPGIDQTVSEYTQRFRTAGMSSSEMITLIACGHTIGGVRKKEIPVLFSNTGYQDVYQHFDSTGNKFDMKVASEYLAKKTKNPLVTAADTNLRSDAKIFGSDGGATLRNLTSTKTQGLTACKNVLTKMIDSVPKGVTLTETIKILPAKVIEPRLTVESGRLIFQADLRLTQAVGSKPPSNRIVTLFWCDKRGSAANCVQTMNTAKASVFFVPPSSPVALQEGFYFNQYSFRVPISSSKSVGKFWFIVKDGSRTSTYNNDGTFYNLKQDNIIFTPRLASSSSISMNRHSSFGHSHGPKHHTSQSSSSQEIVVGIRTELSPSKVFVDSLQLAKSNTERPIKSTTVLTPTNTRKAVDGYKFYSGTLRDVSATSGVTFDISATIGKDTYIEEYLTPQTSVAVKLTTPSVIAASVPK